MQIGILNSGNPVRIIFATERKLPVLLTNLGGTRVNFFVFPGKSFKSSAKVVISVPKWNTTHCLSPDCQSLEVSLDSQKEIEVEIMLEDRIFTIYIHDYLEDQNIRSSPSLENPIPLQFVQEKIELRKSENLQRTKAGTIVQ